MKTTAIFINTGRGPTVDESALIKALRGRWIAGAGLDVLEQEPPGGDNPLLKMDNVILTAHVASASARFDPARRRRVGHEIVAGADRAAGRCRCVNPTVLPGSGLQRWQPVSMERGPNFAECFGPDARERGTRGSRWPTLSDHRQGARQSRQWAASSETPEPSRYPDPKSRCSTRASRLTYRATPRSSASPPDALYRRARSGSAIGAACCGATSRTIGS